MTDLLLELSKAATAEILASEGAHVICLDRPNKDAAVGDIDIDKLNINGGSIAIGHPFAATGPRIVTTMANELARSGKQTALLAICAASGLGAAAVLERVD